MIFTSFAEIVSLGIVLPFLGVLTAPSSVYNHSLVQPIVQYLELDTPNQLILPITVMFILAVIIAGATRAGLLYAMTRFSYATGADLSIDIYRRTLYQDYSVHIATNSSKIIDGIISKTGIIIGGIITPVLMLISSTILLISVLSALFVIDIFVAFTISAIFGVLYWLITHYTKQKLKENSLKISKYSTSIVKILQEGLKGIRDVLINGSQEIFCKMYTSIDIPLRRASGANSFISSSPRYVMESLGMVLIAGLAYSMTLSDKGVSSTIPILGAMALGAQRLLPALQQFYSSYSTIIGSQSSLGDVLDLLNQPIENYTNSQLMKTTKIQFDREIKLNNLGFRYNQHTPWIIRNVNISFKKGDRIGFVGKSGSGKSTLLDIIMGLLRSTEGFLEVDGRVITKENHQSWQVNIAHVPQKIYLSDNNIEENIAFGIPIEDVNHKKVKEASELSKINDFISSLPEGYKTLIGEEGTLLSGGQRQRIGIARALYREASVLVFDEATSALDSQTESGIMRSIDDLDKNLTIFIIAHRVDTLKGCDYIVKVENGTLSKI